MEVFVAGGAAFEEGSGCLDACHSGAGRVRGDFEEDGFDGGGREFEGVEEVLEEVRVFACESGDSEGVDAEVSCGCCEGDTFDDFFEELISEVSRDSGTRENDFLVIHDPMVAIFARDRGMSGDLNGLLSQRKRGRPGGSASRWAIALCNGNDALSCRRLPRAQIGCCSMLPAMLSARFSPEGARCEHLLRSGLSPFFGRP